VSRSEGDDAESEEAPSTTEGPLLGLSDADIVRQDNAGSMYQSQAGPSAAPVDGSASGEVAAMSAPAAQPRRRIFGNLFSSLGSNWLRR
jgi:hypothetical protein